MIFVYNAIGQYSNGQTMMLVNLDLDFEVWWVFLMYILIFFIEKFQQPEASVLQYGIWVMNFVIVLEPEGFTQSWTMLKLFYVQYFEFILDFKGGFA